ncbi:hypothetical protein [uncultured Campylobacter sp.]|uniref:hypothetical protein n=1 Tax=uncultured Campylobacter sp. TaxID=218934 RepID=UPI0028ECC815|nr:hypothetical protein [uncultured Campylobacter sp.]
MRSAILVASIARSALFNLAFVFSGSVEGERRYKILKEALSPGGADRNFKRACSRGGANGAQSCAMGRNFSFEILKFQSAFGSAFGYLFSQRRFGVPCGKTQADQRVILKFNTRLGHCAYLKF